MSKVKTKTLTSQEEFTYPNMIALKEYQQERFIRSEWVLHVVKSINNEEVITESGNVSTPQFLYRFFIVESKWIKYVVLTWINTNIIKVLYEDIEFVSTYYWVPETWVKKSLPHINDYFNNIIDEKISAWIASINLDSAQVLSIVNRYSLPASRDLMLVKAIDKYSSEMTKLLESISNPVMGDAFKEVMATMRTIWQKKPVNKRSKAKTS